MRFNVSTATSRDNRFRAVVQCHMIEAKRAMEDLTARLGVMIGVLHTMQGQCILRKEQHPEAQRT